MRKITLLGASGSIGAQTLEIIVEKRNQFKLVAFSVGNQSEKICEILDFHKEVEAVCVKNKIDAEKYKKRYPSIQFFFGDEGLKEIIDHVKTDMIVNALVGFVGFVPTMHALNKGIDVALANKETLVVGGKLINDALQVSKAKIFPIDSEHVALDKCLKNQKHVKRLILTASGGSFRNLDREQLKNVSVEDALKHPSWKMGAKITIDSATMMNKGFEVIEAHYLFNIPIESISILLHDESHIHSLVEFIDGSYLADIGPADMKVPISYAMFKKKRVNVSANTLPIEKFGTFHFKEFDIRRYPCVGYALDAIKIGGTMPTVLNAANEVAVQAFLERKITFLDIERVIKESMLRHRVIKNPNVDDIIYIDRLTKEEAHRIIEEATK